MEAVDARSRTASVMAAEVGFVVHATTVATNAIIEGKIARGGFVTTEGFRDLLEIARQVRPSLYDTPFERRSRSSPATGGDLAERLGPAGEVCGRSRTIPCAPRRDPRREEVERSRSACSTPTSIRSTSSRSARSLPRSCRRPGPAVRRGGARVPRVPARLDDRDHAVIRPVVERYLERIESRSPRAPGEAARDAVERGRLQLEAARTRPVFMVESGLPPACRLRLLADARPPGILSFDMGGTTAKVGLIEDGSRR